MFPSKWLHNLYLFHLLLFVHNTCTVHCTCICAAIVWLMPCRWLLSFDLPNRNTYGTVNMAFQTCSHDAISTADRHQYDVMGMSQLQLIDLNNHLNDCCMRFEFSVNYLYLIWRTVADCNSVCNSIENNAVCNGVSLFSFLAIVTTRRTSFHTRTVKACCCISNPTQHWQ